MLGTFDTRAWALGLLPRTYPSDDAGGMTVTAGGEVHGAERRQTGSTVAAFMDDAGVRHILIVDGATVVGIVSVRDVLPVLLRSVR